MNKIKSFFLFLLFLFEGNIFFVYGSLGENNDLHFKENLNISQDSIFSELIENKETLTTKNFWEQIEDLAPLTKPADSDLNEKNREDDYDFLPLQNKNDKEEEGDEVNSITETEGLDSLKQKKENLYQRWTKTEVRNLIKFKEQNKSFEEIGLLLKRSERSTSHAWQRLVEEDVRAQLVKKSNKWTKEQDQTLIGYKKENISNEEISNHMRLSIHAITNRWKFLRKNDPTLKNLNLKTWTKTEDKILQEHLEEGKTVKEISECMGRSHDSIANRRRKITKMLKAEGKNIPPLSKKKKSHKKERWTPDDITTLKKYKSAKLTLGTIAEKMKRTPESVRSKWINLFKKDSTLEKPKSNNWTGDEMTQLIDYKNAGKTSAEIAKVIKRSENAINKKWKCIIQKVPSLKIFATETIDNERSKLKTDSKKRKSPNGAEQTSQKPKKQK